MRTIAVIGGGAASAAVFGELLRVRPDGAVHWIAGCEQPGRGVAYSTRDENHLLNVRASGMGVFAGDDGQFTDFARKRSQKVRGTDFLPRYDFGNFIQAQVAAEMRAARAAGLSFSVSSAVAVRVGAASGSGYQVELHDGSRLHADAVVLALGIPAPRPLSGSGEDALTGGRYCVDPWSLPEPDAAPGRIMVLGTGLTGVDVLLTAASRWPQAELLAVSRHGRFPVKHPLLPAAPYPHREQLNQSLLSCDRVIDMLRLFRRHQQESGADPAILVEAMRPINIPLWRRLSVRERALFLRHLRRFWDPVRHRMPPVAAQRLQALTEQGRLKVLTARVERIEGEGPLRVVLRPAATMEPTVIPVDLAVQATGLNLSITHSRNPLLLQLLEDGLIDADPLGLGYRATEDFRVMGRDGTAQDGLYAIGPLLAGNFWECIAMPELRVMARRIAERLTGRP